MSARVGRAALFLAVLRRVFGVSERDLIEFKMRYFTLMKPVINHCMIHKKNLFPLYRSRCLCDCALCKLIFCASYCLSGVHLLRDSEPWRT